MELWIVFILLLDGKLICCGSSQFLKEKYNVGYSVTVDINDPEKGEEVIDYINSNVYYFIIVT